MRRNHSNNVKNEIDERKKKSPQKKMNHLKEKCRAAYCRKQSFRLEGRDSKIIFLIS